jgi:hypothetical protein
MICALAITTAVKAVGHTGGYGLMVPAWDQPRATLVGGAANTDDLLAYRRCAVRA